MKRKIYKYQSLSIKLLTETNHRSKKSDLPQYESSSFRKTSLSDNFEASFLCHSLHRLIP